MKYKSKKKMKKFLKVVTIVLVAMVAIYLIPQFLPEDIGNKLKDLTRQTVSEISGDADKALQNLESIYNEYVSENGGEQIHISQPKVDGIQIPAYIPGHQVVDHEYYVLSYNEEWEIPDWVAYTIDLEELNTNVTGRTEDFREDPAITTGSAELSDYRKSGFDRGHLCASADKTSSVEANSSTFLMSNMVPQNHRFNAGLWLKAEDATRDAGRMHGEVFVATGPVITDNMKTIGANKVGVPEACYKVLLVYDNDGNVHTIGMVLPQEYEDGNLKPYFMTVNEVEDITGIDFFPALDDDIEDVVEGTYNLSVWPKSFR